MEVTRAVAAAISTALPEGWRRERLGEVVWLQRGHDLTWRQRRNGQVPVMGSAGINGFHDRALAKGPGVVLGRSGASYGQAHWCSQDYWPHNTALFVTDFRGNDPRFIYYFLKAFDFSQHNSGGAQQSLNRNFIYPITVSIPLFHEQKAIAQALSDVDDLIQSLERLIAKKRDLKQAAMQQLLTGQTRLPGFSGDWELSSVGTEFDVQLGKMLDATGNTGAAKPYLGNKHVQWNRIIVDELPMMRLTPADMERFRLKHGDLLACEGGDVGRAAIWRDEMGECYFQKALHRLRPKRGFDVRLMQAILSLWSSAGMFANYVTQTSIAHLTREKFVTMPLHVPRTAEQMALVEVLSDMDTEIDALEARLAKTRDLKQGMMQELLTGRTRLV